MSWSIESSITGQSAAMSALIAPRETPTSAARVGCRAARGARPVGAEEAEDLPRLDRHRDLHDAARGAVELREGVRLDDGPGAHGSAGPAGARGDAGAACDASALLTISAFMSPASAA